MPWVNAAMFLAILIATGAVFGRYMRAVFAGERTWLTPVLAPLESGIYRLCGIDPSLEMDWKEYFLAALIISLLGTLVLVPASIAAVVPAGIATLSNAGPHGFSEILYAFTSTTANNGAPSADWVRMCFMRLAPISLCWVGASL
jgi:K+-transporting ATPase ATPase A chain